MKLPEPEDVAGGGSLSLIMNLISIIVIELFKLSISYIISYSSFCFSRTWSSSCSFMKVVIKAVKLMYIKIFINVHSISLLFLFMSSVHSDTPHYWYFASSFFLSVFSSHFNFTHSSIYFLFP